MAIKTFIITLIVLAFGVETYAQIKAIDENWLFVSFKDPGDGGIWFATSTDAIHWTALNNDNPVLTPDLKVGRMRDPFITRGNNNDFHLVWTCGNHKIGYAHSTDLVNWSSQQAIPVFAGDTLVKNTWAPELVFNKKTREWVLFWSATIAGKFPETDGQVENGKNHRIYAMRTTDFITFSKPELFFDPGYPVIDATIFVDGKKALMLFKDERRWPLHKQLRYAVSKTVEGPWKVIGDTITAPWTEGPSIIKIDKQYTVFYDSYSHPQHIGAVTSTDLKNWSDITTTLSFPENYKHGAFLKINSTEAKRLQNFGKE